MGHDKTHAQLIQDENAYRREFAKEKKREEQNRSCHPSLTEDQKQQIDKDFDSYVTQCLAIAKKKNVKKINEFYGHVFAGLRDDYTNKITKNWELKNMIEYLRQKTLETIKNPELHVSL